MGKFGKYPLPKFLMKRLGQLEEDANLVDQDGVETDETSDNEQIENFDRNDSKVREEKGYVFESFEAFQENEDDSDDDDEEIDDVEELNEDDMIHEPVEMAQPCEGCSDYPDMLSEKAKQSIKNICETVLIQEAQVVESSDDPNQTYESFLRECTHYMAECLIRAAQNLRV